MSVEDTDGKDLADRDKPWTDKELMRRLYIDEWNSSIDIANMLECSKKTVLNWLDRHGIETRSGRPPIRKELTDKRLLCEWYYDEGLLYSEMADRLDVSNGAIRNAMIMHGITPPHSIATKRRIEARDQAPPPFRTNTEGREVWSTDGRTVLVHRLVAVAEYGFDAVAGKAVHHKNNIPWDNRPENLVPIEHGDHSKYHWDIYHGNSKPDWQSDPEYLVD